MDVHAFKEVENGAGWLKISFSDLGPRKLFIRIRYWKYEIGGLGSGLAVFDGHILDAI